ncbi:Hypothetical protein SLIV_36398 [Streptomyces lividans TK24]|uniref:Secreted protein n=1 Tax=Streptomyces lividans TK24 TaxID=457428 RepID=A0ABX6TPM7_STRLI|nr:Hypothetical protein SLIV_36398 [Streptomyces lividans TK24]QSJ13772.1 Hypothetical protein SLIVDG2_36398 [Streptomyces lividans]QTD74682.1 Hypothetical protein SLIVYQS_36398 [Streptomyces lividans TK24] [Streptomyces lividans]
MPHELTRTTAPRPRPRPRRRSPTAPGTLTTPPTAPLSGRRAGHIVRRNGFTPFAVSLAHRPACGGCGVVRALSGPGRRFRR